MTYESFLKKSWVKLLVRRLIDESINYDINNNFARIEVKTNQTKEQTKILIESFDTCLKELELVNQYYISNQNIDSYLYQLLRNGQIKFAYTNSNNYRLIEPDAKADISIDATLTHSNNDSYLYSLYKSIDSRVDFKSNLMIDISDDDYRKVDNDKEFTMVVSKMNLTGTQITKKLNSEIISLLDKALDVKLSNHITGIRKLGLRICNFLGKKVPSYISPFKYHIVLNSSQTIVDDVKGLEKKFKQEFKDELELLTKEDNKL